MVNCGFKERNHLRVLVYSSDVKIAIVASTLVDESLEEILKRVKIGGEAIDVFHELQGS